MTYHFLLVGVDGYPNAPLRGCVNDVDAMQRVVLGPRMAVDRTRIRRLVSPVPGRHHDTTIPERPATLANIRAALAELASDHVMPDDRVFILFSGHGLGFDVTTRCGRTFRREAFVPVDFDADPPRVLFDFELNERLAKIVRRTRSVTLVLDCCRTGRLHLSQSARYIDLEQLQRWVPPADLEASGHEFDPGDHRLGGQVDDCHVVSACMNHEFAKEDEFDGTWHGLLTWALITALDAAPDVNLQTVTWARIWQAIRADVELRNPWQHVWMQGNALRAVFAGPPVDGDAGIPVSRADDAYRIEAGTLASITPGAVLAVYGERPAHFPRLGSAEARACMLGTLHVTRAERAFATAEAIGAFDLPAGARAQLVRAASETRLRCGVKPADRRIEEQIRRSPLLELVAPGEPATVWLELIDGRWLLTDEIHGGDANGPILCALDPADLDRAREVLEHYREYAWPIRVAQRATDLPGAIDLRVLACGDRTVSANEAHAINLPEAPSSSMGGYCLRPGDRHCFSAHNRSIHRLRVTLFQCSATGEVRTLGEQVVNYGASSRFWAHGDLGVPFQATPWNTKHTDRVIAIGRTEIATDLRYLRVDRTFAQVIQRSRSAGRVLDDGSWDDHYGPEQWTAAQVLIETSAR